MNALTLFVLVLTVLALAYLIVQLYKAQKRGNLINILRDLLIIFLAIMMMGLLSYLVIQFIRLII
ncbi:MAG: hypothetical protein CMD58_06090 [Gammaproteobacteria bacterium]|nr:hypothetical protein [Gammaproteobacteria bacterium]